MSLAFSANTGKKDQEKARDTLIATNIKLHHIIKLAAIPLYTCTVASLRRIMHTPLDRVWSSSLLRLAVYFAEGKFHVSVAIQEDISNMEPAPNTGT